MARRHLAVAVVLLAVGALAAACGDDAATTTTAPATTAAATTAAATTTAPVTTEATTTTAATTTTSSDLHPVWGIPWSSLWPPEGATATYRLSVWNQEPLDLPATIEYGMEWQDGTWDRIQIGSSEPGELGLAFYFDRSEPWAIRVWGVRVTAPGLGENGFMDEYLDGFPAVDLSGLPDTAPTLDVDAFVDTGRDDIFGPSPAIYAMEVVGLEEITVAAGTFPVTLHVRFGLGGEFFGLEPGQEINSFSDLWLDPTQLILRWDPSPGLGTPLELVSPWE